MFQIQYVSKPREQCCRSGMFIPDPNFFIPDPGLNYSGSRIRIRIKEFKFLTQKIVYKLSEIRSGLFYFGSES
jgi:hypothetical protein